MTVYPNGPELLFDIAAGGPLNVLLTPGWERTRAPTPYKMPQHFSVFHSWSKIQRHIHELSEIFDVCVVVISTWTLLDFTCLFTIIDRYTRWPKAIPLKDSSSKECARALTSTLIARVGVSLDMPSDQGTQFNSSLWPDICLLQLRHAAASLQFVPSIK